MGRHANQVSAATAIAKAALLLALFAAGCAPVRHTIEPYAGDAAQAQALEARAAAACAPVRPDGVLPPRRFTTDGCSLWPDGEWRQCCIEHDIAYWCGGPAAARDKADLLLRACVVAAGREDAAAWMYYAVRLGGGPLLPFPWRWGYGWDWPDR